MELLSNQTLAILALVAGAFVGAAAVFVWQRRQGKTPEPAKQPAETESEEAPRQEARRYFLFNETGNVLISTSLSPTGRLPDTTLALFSEALSHLSAIFFAIAGSKDENGEAFSLYNYGVLKRALALHPVFIPVSAEKPADVEPVFKIKPLLYAAQPAETDQASVRTEPKDPKAWLEERVKHSRDALGMDDSPENVQKLRAIHSQMRAEAKRLGAKRFRRRPLAQDFLLLKSAPLVDLNNLQDQTEAEVGHITLYCECLMGVSLVSLKLSHAYFEDYLNSDASEMEQDTYLFVSPSQLKNTIHELSNLPRMNLGR